MLRLSLKASDSTGKVWVSKEYKDLASKYSYKGINEDPFQDLYNDFANDLLRFRESLSEKKIERIEIPTSVVHNQVRFPIKRTMVSVLVIILKNSLFFQILGA